jgi:hypothetical protein
MRNLNIKSDEAYELAHFIAGRTGKNLTLVVTEALRKQEMELTHDERLAKLNAIAEESGKMWPKDLKNEDYNDFLYDEFGLPK